VELTACGAVLLSLASACAALALGWGETHTATLHHWFQAGGFTVAADVLLDPLSLVMAVLVTFVSFVVHCYAVAFMRGDEGYRRFYCYLNLFVFFMLVITLADNLVFLFLGWEGVGLCSFLLIGHWLSQEERTAAGRKAFLLTRIGDVAFLIAIAVVFAHFSSPSVSAVHAEAGTVAASTATLLGLLLLWAAAGKSAQFPLLVWLPDAMAGPTPVSALIHAATMVTAGVYLLARLFPLLAQSSAVLSCIAAIGVLTALWGAASALVQRDIKRVLAWSTVSQVGFMVLALGAGDPAGSMFHLVAHAFFKSLLFLAAGCIIKALDEEHDILAMGWRVRHDLPRVFWPFLVGVLALAAVPPVSGFFSKGRILSAVLAQSGWGSAVLACAASAAALLTALYSFRLLFLVFFGQPAEKAPPLRPGSVSGSMTAPLLPLALLALGAGLLNLPGHNGISNWLTRALATVPGVPGAVPQGPEAFVAVLDGLIAGAGLLLGLFLYGPRASRARPAPAAERGGLRWLLEQGLGLDLAYERFLARPYRCAARALYQRVETQGLDGTSTAAAGLLARASSGVRLWTTGRLSTYLCMLLAGLALIALIAAAGWV
jgi:NADH-quinone oxidoreductase subunit L